MPNFDPTKLNDFTIVRIKFPATSHHLPVMVIVRVVVVDRGFVPPSVTIIGNSKLSFVSLSKTVPALAVVTAPVFDISNSPTEIINLM